MREAQMALELTSELISLVNAHVRLGGRVGGLIPRNGLNPNQNIELLVWSDTCEHTAKEENIQYTNTELRVLRGKTLIYRSSPTGCHAVFVDKHSR